LKQIFLKVIFDGSQILFTTVKVELIVLKAFENMFGYKIDRIESPLIA
jgi:hypothetical protein